MHPCAFPVAALRSESAGCIKLISTGVLRARIRQDAFFSPENLNLTSLTEVGQTMGIPRVVNPFAIIGIMHRCYCILLVQCHHAVVCCMLPDFPTQT